VRHLYVHVPFCVRRCSYCDFSIAVRRRIPAHRYVALVLDELRLAATAAATAARATDAAGAGHGAGEATVGPLETLYLGGGTPSLLPSDALAQLFRGLRDELRVASAGDAVEVTLEANPEDVTADSAAAWRRAGVNRVSLGAQSFDDRVLAWMHRSHDAARIGAAVRTLRAAGITNQSLDLIFALPTELERDWARDMDAALSLAPSHLSLYGLTVEERTPLARWISRGAASAPDDERYAAEYLAAHERLGAAGYSFYEVSNACRDGQRSRHNSAYWSGRPYRGLGPAAHSYDGRARRWNLRAWEAYGRALAAGRSVVEAEEVLTPAQRELERVYLALRTSDGLERGALGPRAPLARWAERGWVALTPDRVRCTPEGWLRLDALVSDLTGTAE
jgi:oxygen-independent coproporphyrinogen III oxidase